MPTKNSLELFEEALAEIVNNAIYEKDEHAEPNRVVRRSRNLHRDPDGNLSTLPEVNDEQQ